MAGEQYVFSAQKAGKVTFSRTFAGILTSTQWTTCSHKPPKSLNYTDFTVHIKDFECLPIAYSITYLRVKLYMLFVIKL